MIVPLIGVIWCIGRRLVGTPLDGQVLFLDFFCLWTVGWRYLGVSLVFQGFSRLLYSLAKFSFIATTVSLLAGPGRTW